MVIPTYTKRLEWRYWKSRGVLFAFRIVEG